MSLTICAFCPAVACEGLAVIPACDTHWEYPEREAARLEDENRRLREAAAAVGKLGAAREQEIRDHLSDGENPSTACVNCDAYTLLYERDAAVQEARLAEALQAQATGAQRQMETALAETRARLIGAEQQLRARH